MGDPRSPRREKSREHRQGERRNFVGSGNDGFRCARCGAGVEPLAFGGFRNHCPHCLWSRHVDVVPGDRKAGCGGMMEPVRVEGSSSSGWKITHRCLVCGEMRANQAALDDPREPDSWDRILEIASGMRGTPPSHRR